jgi:hypothetical protein
MMVEKVEAATGFMGKIKIAYVHARQPKRLKRYARWLKNA